MYLDCTSHLPNYCMQPTGPRAPSATVGHWPTNAPTASLEHPSFPALSLDDAFQRLQSALVDRYQIERELDRGGMAPVYLARDLKHDRLVAIKVLLPVLSATLGTVTFLREIQLAARPQHHHVLVR